MNKTIIIDYTQNALLDFIQIAYKEHYEIIKTTVKEEHQVVFVYIRTMKILSWEYEDFTGNKYINMSSCKNIYSFIQ